MNKSSPMIAPLILASLKRRLACTAYEMLLLLAVIAFGFMLPHLLLGIWWQVMAPGWLSILHLFAVLAVYFVSYWGLSGQTLAMQTWKIRLVRSDGQPVGLIRAFWRFVLASSWIVPAILIDKALGVSGATHILVFAGCAVLFSLLSALFDRDNLFLYDRLAHTRLVKSPATSA